MINPFEEKPMQLGDAVMKGEDYRSEVQPHPVEALRGRKTDNVTIARTKQMNLAKV